MLDLIIKVAREAGELIEKQFYKDKRIVYKTDFKDLVTALDIECQQYITLKLTEGMDELGINTQEVGFIGEEGLSQKGKHLFVIDPIDGTANYASGLEYFAISIAYVKDGQLECGVVYDPHLDLMFYAKKGEGAWRESNGVKTTLYHQERDLKDVLFNGQFNSQVFQSQFDLYAKIFPKIRSFRSIGSVALGLCRVADNVFGVSMNGKAYIWDIAAACLILQESGVELVDWQGKKIILDFADTERSYKLIATSNKILPEILKDLEAD